MCPPPTKKAQPCMSMKQLAVTISRYDLYNSSPLMSIHKRHKGCIQTKKQKHSFDKQAPSKHELRDE